VPAVAARYEGARAITNPASESVALPSRGAKITYAGDDGFHAEIKRRVNEYFSRTGLSPHGGWRMILKTATILLWFAASYILLIFGATTWYQGALAALSLVLAVAGTGFAIQHDANHGAYSSKDVVNRIMGMTLDMLGASSYVWHWKHNILHHTYPNMTGADPDLNAEPFARLAPGQPRRRLHRAQQFYMWGLYGFLYLKWHLVDDFQNVVQGRIASNRFPRPRGLRLLELVVGKAVFFGWALVVPLLFHRWWVVLLFYGVMSSVLGMILAVVFQLAHCTEAATFPRVSPGTMRVSEGWAAHQVHTTVDFARRNPVLTWYLGGLNFQVEHHLFPRVCHIHYPRISRIVEAGCLEFGVRYAAYDGMLSAVTSHWRWLERMGRA
jgi:linoleoyl-CoA desaturase